MRLIVYGSFNCPYSYLASLRADRLTATGDAEVEWRAVVHEPEVPEAGTPVSGDLAAMFDEELAQIRGSLLLPGELYPAKRPPVQPNTTRAVAGYGAAPGHDAGRLRGALFDAFWVQGLDIGDPAVLRQVGCPDASGATAMERWRRDWLDLGEPMVPMTALADGSVARGLGALERLAGLLTA